MIIMKSKKEIKEEIEKVDDKHLDTLYNVVKSLESPLKAKESPGVYSIASKEEIQKDWSGFINETYGCLADDPISRGDQGAFEIREPIE
ncbi:MAG: hypothetical protein GY754_08440 [bacterium]|nr:hypothetical protein [bacterium]